jgi:hypothetical protein
MRDFVPVGKSFGQKLPGSDLMTVMKNPLFSGLIWLGVILAKSIAQVLKTGANPPRLWFYLFVAALSASFTT